MLDKGVRICYDYDTEELKCKYQSFSGIFILAQSYTDVIRFGERNS